MRARVAFESRRPSYLQAQQREWRPVATYALLGAVGGVYLMQNIVAGVAPHLHNYLFAVAHDFYLRPWSLITSTLAHGGTGHLFFNGLVLYFFGPTVERLWGRKKFLILFFVAGALAGVLNSLVMYALGDPRGALGASGALMMILGALAVMMPKAKILLFFVLPMPFWAAAVGFAVIDVLGFLHGATGIGHIAHLSGMAMGVYLGWQTKQRMQEQGMRLVYE